MAGAGGCDLRQDRSSSRDADRTSSRPGASTWVYDPTWSTGLPGAGWTPLMECLNWQGAQRVADWLVRAARPASATSRGRRLLVRRRRPRCSHRSCSRPPAAAERWRRSSQWVDGQEDEPVRFALEANGEEEAVTRIRGDLDVGRTDPRQRLRDGADGPHRLHRPGRSRLGHDAPSSAPSASSTAAATPRTSALPRTSSAACNRCSQHSSRRSSRTPTTAAPRPASRSTRRCSSSSTSAPTSHPCATSPRSPRPARDRGSSSSRSSKTWRRSTPSTAATARRPSSPTTAQR